MREIKFRAFSRKFKGMIFWVDATDDGGVPVMQYTGLKDKNGKEIYEGDILKETSPRGNKYQVFGVEGGFAINTHQDEIKNPRFWEPLSDMQNSSYVKSGCEIIGNIYENPELLNQTT